jgi:hypothetical protein
MQQNPDFFCALSCRALQEQQLALRVARHTRQQSLKQHISTDQQSSHSRAKAPSNTRQPALHSVHGASQVGALHCCPAWVKQPDFMSLPKSMVNQWLVVFCRSLSKQSGSL